MDEPSIRERLKRIELFKGIREDEQRLAGLAGIVSLECCLAGTEVIKEGEEGDSLYILNKGTVSVHKKTLHDDSYTMVTLKDDEDVIFGELALLDEARRSATVKANTDCEFLVIHRDDFNRLGEGDPLLGLLVTRELGRALSAKLRKTDEDLIILFEALVGEVAEEGNLDESSD
jgi:CRP/FNR family cyclic AMP-dependent transcriptional regulator